MYKSNILVSLVLSGVVFAADSPRTCASTPNGEQSSCIPVLSCPSILSIIQSRGTASADFVRQFHCGFEGRTPLVCCTSNVSLKTESPNIAFKIFEENENVQVVENERVRPVENEYIQPIEHHLLPDRTLCGLQLKRNIAAYNTYKNVTYMEEFPWMTALYYTKQSGNGGEFKCSGTLINNRYVLTAARCLDIPNFNLTAVRLGEWRFSSAKDCIENTALNENTCSDPVVNERIVKKKAHVYYNSTTGSNDIALLRLESKIQFSEYIRPICLPPNELPIPEPGSSMTVSGWGLTETGARADIKLKSHLKVLPSGRCNETSKFISAGPCIENSDGKRFCNGESGGPLLRKFEIRDEDDIEQWYQEGIIYAGLGCKRSAGVYTRISKYVNWILNKLEP